MKTIYLGKADKLTNFVNWDAMPGLFFATGIAAIATFLHTRSGFVLLSPLILATILGMFVRNTVGISKRFQPGIVFSLKK
ncbi:MAG: putative sulfate exporter family transporter, partial [Cyanobacteria bacterium J06641_5]